MITECQKHCSGCGETKPLSDFYRNSRRPDGRQIWCKACSRAAVDKYQARVGKSVAHRSVKYGLTKEEVRLMLAIPVCQACGESLGNSYTMKFDHCHHNGHFRGVLCHHCNMACIGQSADAVRRLRCCIQYLERDAERTL